MAVKRAGTVVRVAQGLAIARCPDESYPDVGAAVVDESLSPVGRVVDVFGPVERPYVAVTPNDGVAPADLLGEKLYAK